MHFRSRLLVVLLLFIACWLGLSLRLFHLQVVRARDYQEDSEQRRLVATRLLAPMRGRILDRHGRELARDEPAWGVAVHYRLLCCSPLLTSAEQVDQAYLKQLVRHAAAGAKPGSPEFQEAQAQVRDELASLWAFLTEWDGREALAERIEHIVKQVRARRDGHIRRHALTASPQTAVVGEERECHPVLEGLSKREEIQIRLWHQNRFESLVASGAVEITDSTRRVYPEGQALAHVVGLLSEVTEDAVLQRPFRDAAGATDWSGYRFGDLHGSAGVERQAEEQLRGGRGQVQEFIDDRPPNRHDPQSGSDVALTIDAALQKRVYELLGQAIQAHNLAAGAAVIPGGSVVVVDVVGRQVLALVSYPAYDPETLRQDYARLIRDAVSRPLVNRAVQVQYCPGSIVKPITIAAACQEELIDLESHLDCHGSLDPDHPAIFRCWRPAGQSAPNRHGSINSQAAIRGSCNVFCFKLGNEFCEHFGGPAGGVATMCAWLERFGAGHESGLGLPGERSGLLPTPEWLSSNRPGNPQPLKADARNYAIGQGELEITPVQAANIAATYASGELRPVTLLARESGRPGQRLPVGDAVWRAIRGGMYEVVNHPEGTAPSARLRSAEFCLCGKSGSAQTPRWAVRFRVRHAHGEDLIEAQSESQARRAFLAGHPDCDPARLQVQCAGWFPSQPVEEDRSYAHAWFAAFVQPLSGGSPAWSQPAPLAIAVLLEFGGSGGTVAGPVCRDVAELIIAEFPEYVRQGVRP